MHRITVLWSVPRSVSTAFERMMRERGDHEVVFEPFDAHYYFSEQRRSPRYDGEVEPQPEHAFEAIVDRLLRAAEQRPVFVKDMAYYVADRADESFLGLFTNTFLVRHPRLALRSMVEHWPDFTVEEAGFGALRQLFDAVRDMTGEVPPVIDGEDLKADPERTVRAWCEAVGIDYLPEALSWEPGRVPEWGRWSEWMGTVEQSSGLPTGEAGSARDPDEVTIEDEYTRRVVAACTDDYEHVARHAL